MNSNKSHESLMLEAVKLSEHAIKTNSGGPFGAVIVKNGKVIAQGFNQVLKTNDPTAHAEITAIREACKLLNTFDLSDCEIYTSCEPCPMCLSACYWANLSKIYYSNTRKDAENIGFKDNFIYEELSTALEKTNSRLIKIDLPEALIPFEEWQQKPDKVGY